MNYVDTLSETDEFRAWEEGRLQGLKDIQRETRFKVNASLQSIINKMVDEQQDFLDEVYGEDE
jgi:hypothetical protein